MKQVFENFSKNGTGYISFYHFLDCFIVGEKADVNKRDDRGKTPLMIASQFGHIGVLKGLLEFKANPNHVNQ